MAVKETVNKSVQPLIEKFQKEGNKIANLLAEIPYSDDKSKRELYTAVVAILVLLQEYSRDWAATTLKAAYRDAELEAIARLEISGSITEEDFADLVEPELTEIYNDFDREIQGALDSIHGLANAFVANHGVGKYLSSSIRIALLAGAATAVTIAEMRRQLREHLSESLVTVIARNGQSYTYALDYYAGLSARNKVLASITRAAMGKAYLANHDLLRVSPQASTIGDYCDEYRGKVVSISGSSDKYPHISALPNGGAPFHPHCYHFMEVYYEGMEETGKIRPEFVELAESGNPTPNDFQKLWRQVRRG